VSDEEMTCQELVELITAYLEDAMDGPTLAKFEEHLSWCDGCGHYIEQFRVTIRTVGRIKDEDIEPAFRDRLLEAFRSFG
jgi:predicted anti-sigma-YlaC factor YlaD